MKPQYQTFRNDAEDLDKMRAIREAEDRGVEHDCEDAGEGECWFCGAAL